MAYLSGAHVSIPPDRISIIYKKHVGQYQILSDAGTPAVVDLSDADQVIVTDVTGSIASFTTFTATNATITSVSGTLDAASRRDSHILAVATVSASHAVDPSIDVFACSVPGSPITGTLPTAVGHDGMNFVFKKTDATDVAYVIAAQPGQTIDGSAEVAMVTQYTALKLVAINGAWSII